MLYKLRAWKFTIYLCIINRAKINKSPFYLLSRWRRLDDQDIAQSDVLWDQFALMSLELHLCVGTRRVHKQPKAKTCNIYYYVITTSKYVGLHIQLWRLIIMNVHQCKWQYEIYYQKNKALNIKTNCQNLLKTSFLALWCNNQASTILSFLNYLTTNISFVKSVEICMWPLRFTPGVDGWKYGRKINCVQFIVNELSDVPRKIVVAEIWK